MRRDDRKLHVRRGRTSDSRERLRRPRHDLRPRRGRSAGEPMHAHGRNDPLRLRRGLPSHVEDNGRLQSAAQLHPVAGLHWGDARVRVSNSPPPAGSTTAAVTPTSRKHVEALPMELTGPAASGRYMGPEDTVLVDLGM